MQSADYRRVPVHQGRGRARKIVAYTLVDADDYALAISRTWFLSRGYAKRMAAPGRHEYLHRLLLGLAPGDGLSGDHINRDPLDNRRANLRVVTQSQNMQNVSSHRGSASRFRGIYWDPRKRRWRGRVRSNGKAYNCGSHRTEVAAALAVQAERDKRLPLAQPDPELVKLGLA